MLVHARFGPWICQFIWWLHSPWNSQIRTAEQRVVFWREYIMNNNKTCIWVGMFPFVKIWFIWKRNCFSQMYDLLSFFFFWSANPHVSSEGCKNNIFHTRTHIHTQQQLMAQQTSIWHLFFFHFYDKRWKEREREKRERERERERERDKCTDSKNVVCAWVGVGRK